MERSLSKRVTVVIPAFNAGRFLEQTLFAAKNAQPFEIIIVNDGSIDSTLEIAENFRKKFSDVKIISKENEGESSAINVGISEVKTEFLLILSADDLISPKLLFTAVKILDNDDSAVAAYPSWEVIDVEGRFIREYIDLGYSTERLLGKLICLPGPGSVIRTSAMSTGRNKSLTQIGDFEQWLRLSYLGHMVHINEVLASWRTHTDNMTWHRSAQKQSQELDVVLETVKNLFGPLGSKPVSASIWNSFLSNWFRQKAIAELRVTGSWKSVPYLYRSVLILKGKGLFLAPWNSMEIIICLFPGIFRTLERNEWFPSLLWRRIIGN